MSLFIESAYASTGAAGGQESLLSFLPMLLLIPFVYFMIIRPQTKRTKEQRQLLNSIEVGNEVVFAGGLMGRVKKIEGEYAVITISSNVDLKIQKSSIITVLPTGTLASL